MGCIYLLEDCNGFGYIGKTKNLKARLNQHRYKNNNNKSRSRYLNNFECLVLEEFDYEDDLDSAEQFYYDLYKDLYGDKIVNGCRPLQTKNQYYETHKEHLLEHKKEWREKNKEQILEQHKKYYENNKEQILEQLKNYYENNKKRIAERRKHYYENYKEKVSEQKKQKITCECGSVITRQMRSRHAKSIKHQNYLSKQ
jgi:hypothetical protein